VQVLGRMMVSRGDVGGANRNLPPKVLEPLVIDQLVLPSLKSCHFKILLVSL